jgi:hypothetical protein
VFDNFSRPEHNRIRVFARSIIVATYQFVSCALLMEAPDAEDDLMRELIEKYIIEVQGYRLTLVRLLPHPQTRMIPHRWRGVVRQRTFVQNEDMN